MTGLELAAKREKCGLTQDQLAHYLGMGRTSVWRMEISVDAIPRSVELALENFEPWTPAFETWLEALPPKSKRMIRRRQTRSNAEEVAAT